MFDGIDRRVFLGTLAASAITPERRGAIPRSTQDSDAAVFAAVRNQFLISKDTIYGNTGTLGASPIEVLEAQVDCLRMVERDLAAWPDLHPDIQPMTGYGPLSDVRAEVGRLLNSPVDEIALVQNATMAMSFVANGLDLSPGDEILTTDEEHVGGINAWLLRAKRHGTVVRELPLNVNLQSGPAGVLQLFSEAITPRTRVIMFSHVTSARGNAAAGQGTLRTCRPARCHIGRRRCPDGGPDRRRRKGHRL